MVFDTETSTSVLAAVSNISKNCLTPFEQTAALLWSTNKDLMLTYIATPAIPSLSPGLESRLGKSFLEAFAESGQNARGRSQLAAAAHLKALSGQTAAFEIELHGRSLLANVRPLYGENGAVNGVIGLALDDTERSVAERALRLSEQSYRTLIEEAPYAICRATATGRMLQANRAMMLMLAYESEAELLLASMRLDIFAALADYDRFVEGFAGPVARYGFESTWRRAGGQPIVVSLGGRAVRDEAGQISYFEILAEDISPRRQLENQLRQAQKMEAIGQLAGGVAHDFNNLLTVIRGQVELALMDLTPGAQTFQRLIEVEQAADRASALTRQLLAFGRIQAVQNKSLNLNTVLSGLLQLLNRLLGKNICLRFLPGEPLHRVEADPSQMEQILMNLVVNARDAMPNGGDLTIRTYNRSLDENTRDGLHALENGDYVVIEVADSGFGMDADTQARIFEPFFTTKTLGQGTGLGLFTVYSIVRQCKGYIHVESEPGKGATFTVYLPRAVSAVLEAPQTLVQPINGGHETIVLAEDDAGIRTLFTTFLLRLGYRVFPASDGKEALQLALDAESKIDLLISDVVMPNMGGRELAEQLSKLLPDLKIILMSGYSGGDPAISTMKQVDVLLQKPFSANELARKVREVLDREPSARLD